LIDRDGKPIKRYGHLEDPFSFEKDIIALLAKPETNPGENQNTEGSSSSSSPQ